MGTDININERAKKIKLLLLDVDGILTDGGIITANSGNESKIFGIRDGLGVVLMKKAGFKCVIITAMSSRLVKVRAKHLGIDKVYGNHFKLELLEDIKRRFKVANEEICYIGDDLIDIPILKRVGFAVSVPGGVDEAKGVAHYITKKEGGRGAVREICEIILNAQGKWQEVTKRYFE